MNEICTSIEQSKKLLELGIDVNTSDMYWSLTNKNQPPIIGNYCAEYCGMQLPAWSFTALLELMSLINEYNIEYRPIIERYADDGWACKYYNEETRSTDDVYVRRYGRTPLDAAFKMICWLKENNKL